MAHRQSRYDKALSRLPSTLEWSRKQDIGAVREFLTAPDGLPRIFLGSGGSFSVAQLAMQLSVEAGFVAAAMTPYQYIFSAWSRLPARVFIFSAGGRNIDALNAWATARDNPSQTFGAMLMSEPSKLAAMMEADGAGRAFVYRQTNGDGFLAVNSLAAYYSLLFRIYRGDEVCVDVSGIAEALESQLKAFLTQSYTLSTDGWNAHDAALYDARETDRFYVLYSPDTMPVACDLESRFSESSVGCLQISDYRNFAHGRFNWFHQRRGQTAIIALVTPESEDVAASLLSELPPYIPVMRLDTSLKGSQGTMDLLVKGMYLVKFMGLRWGLDVGTPDVPEFGRIIYHKDFMKEN